MASKRVWDIVEDFHVRLHTKNAVAWPLKGDFTTRSNGCDHVIARALEFHPMVVPLT